jgi:hypothetical protein
MTRQTWLLSGAVILAVVLWFALSPSGDERVTADLIDQFDAATEKRPNPSVFSIVDATITGESRRAIQVAEPSRLVYTVTVPDDGALRFSLGLQESAWGIEGDGVLFRVLVAAGAPPSEVLNVHLNPYSNAGDRIWHDLTVDLSEFSGETVDLYFNTNASLPHPPGQDDRNGDLALWGEPRVIAR